MSTPPPPPDNQAELLLAALDASPLGVLVFDSERRLKHANDRWFEIAGIRREDLPIGTKAAQATEVLESVLELPEALRPTSDRVKRDPTTVIRDLELQLRSGRTVKLYAAPLYSSETSETTQDAGANVAGRLSLLIDVTEARRLQEEVRHAQRLETISTMAGGIGHDFNNQLTAIFGNAMQAAEAAPDNPVVQTALENLSRAAERCASLVRGLLTFSQRMPLKIQEVDVEVHTRDLKSVIQTVIPETVQLSVHVDSNVGFVRADPNQLQQVLLNLCLNSVDAMKSRGQLTLRVSRQENTVHSSEGETRSDVVLFEVEDDGHGMDPDLLRRIFDPFFTTKPAGEATGLGLSVVYGLVNGMNGWIEVDSQPDEGTHFRVFLPAGARKNRLEGAAVREEESEVVLVADDEDDLRRLIRLALERKGYNVIEAVDGLEAMDIYNRDDVRVGLIILDITMPRMDGFQVLEAVRKVSPELPIILSSGDFGRAKADYGDTVELLPKPYSPDQLIQVVRQAAINPRRG